MERPPTYFSPELYVETTSGNKISRKSIIRGTDYIKLSGKAIIQDLCIIRGDLADIKIGKYVILQEAVILKPTYKKTKGTWKFVPLTIGDYVTIGSNTIINAAKIGSCVSIGKNCVISHKCVIEDNAKIADDSYLPPDTIVPPYTYWSGKPDQAIFHSEMPESTPIIHKDIAMTIYKTFLPSKPGSAALTKQLVLPNITTTMATNTTSQGNTDLTSGRNEIYSTRGEPNTSRMEGISSSRSEISSARSNASDAGEKKGEQRDGILFCFLVFGIRY